MKKIKVIIKGRKFTEKLFGLKERQIRRVIEAARDNAEKQKEEASIELEKLYIKLADDDVNFSALINAIILSKQTIKSADETIEALNEISADLESEVEIDDDCDEEA